MIATLRPTVGAELAGAITLAAALQFAFIALGYLSDNPAGVISSNLRPYAAVSLAACAVMLTVMGRHRRAAIFILAALMVFAHLGRTLYAQRSNWATAWQQSGHRELTVVTFNVYNRNPQDSAHVAAALAQSSADILVLTEAVHLRPQMPLLRQRFPYAAGCVEPNWGCDTVILSVHPVSDAQIKSLGPIYPNRFVSAKIAIGSDALTVVAAHLTKPYFDNHGWNEIWRLTELVDSLPGPLLLAGDFNAAPWSRSIKALLATTKLLPAPMPVATWPSAIGGLGVPIDHVFTRAPAVLDRLSPLPDNLGSNHRGLIAKLRY